MDILSNRSNISRYKKDIAQYPVLTPAQEEQVIMDLNSNDTILSQQAQEKIIKHNLKFAYHIAKQYRELGIEFEDILQAANEGLVAASKPGFYKHDRGAKFISFAVRSIRAKILALFESNGREKYLLPALHYKKLKKIDQLVQDAEKRGMPTPDREEISKIIDIPTSTTIEHYIQILEHIGNIDNIADLSLGINTDGDQTTEDQNSITLYNTKDTDPGYSLHQESLHTEIERSLETLTPREADVVRLYFGLGNQNHLTLEEIAETFDLTRLRVHQIKEKAIRRLKHVSRNKLLKKYLGDYDTTYPDTDIKESKTTITSDHDKQISQLDKEIYRYTNRNTELYEDIKDFLSPSIHFRLNKQENIKSFFFDKSYFTRRKQLERTKIYGKQLLKERFDIYLGEDVFESRRDIHLTDDLDDIAHQIDNDES